MSDWGIGKQRSKVGKFIDSHGYTQEDLMRVSRISRNTVSAICSNPEYIPSTQSLRKLMPALRKLDPNVKVTDFYDI